MLTFHFFEDIFPGRLVFVGHRLHERLDEILSGLHPKDGQYSPLCLYPQGLLIGTRVCTK